MLIDLVDKMLDTLICATAFNILMFALLAWLGYLSFATVTAATVANYFLLASAFINHIRKAIKNV